MDKSPNFHTTAKSGADSVFNYIERTAEVVSDGIRWQTLNGRDEPQYDVSVFDGVAGISFFLSDYYHLTGNPKACDLTEGALQWCSVPERNRKNRSLYRGWAGIGMGWRRLAEVTDDNEALQKACELADKILQSPVGPNSTDFMGGAAGKGTFMIRLWEASREERFLSRAVQNGEWLESVVEKEEDECYWRVRVDIPNYRLAWGFGHGIAGIGYFLLLLYEVTKDSRWADLARGTAQSLTKHAISDRGGLNWPVDNDRGSGLIRCQWCNGSPGVGLFYTKAYELLGDTSYLQTADAAGETTFQYGDVRNNPCQCHGLAGNAELFIELYRITTDEKWLERAHDFAKRALAYRKTTPKGDLWQNDEPGYYSPDFLCGAAGTGHFFLRLLAPDRLRMPLL